MTFIYTPYIWPFICTIILNMIMTFYVLKNWRRNGVAAFIITLLCSSLWSLGIVMEISMPELHSKLFWKDIAFPAYTFGPLAWMIMVMQITDRGHWINKKRVILLSIIPIVTIMLVWTNHFHGLIWKKIYLSSQNGFSSFQVNHGLWFWIHAVYSDGLNLFSVMLAAHFWRSKAPLYGKQFRGIVFSMLFTMIVNATYVLEIGPIIDTTPIAWGISSLFITWALFRNKLFDLVPIARSRVLESMQESIVVLDLKNRIVDMNPSAQNIFNCKAAESIGCSALEFFEMWPALRELIIKDGGAAEFKHTLGKESGYYEVAFLPMKNERENRLGSLLSIRDITEKKITEMELLQKQQEIAVKEERERMARDLHDNFGQILGFVNVQTQAIREYLKQDQPQTANKCLERLTEIAQEAQQNVRQSILTMRGERDVNENKVSDFFAELNKEVSLFEQRYGIAAVVDDAWTHKAEAYNPKALLQIMNIIKEALNNVIKHSGASTVQITFEEKEKWMDISVIDNGSGFDRTSTVSAKQNKYGLVFMKERAEEIGGCLNVHSERGKGTSVKIHIPRQQLLKERE